VSRTTKCIDTGLLRPLKLTHPLTAGPKMLKDQLKEWAAAMDAEFECIACNVKRIAIGVTLVARGYEMRSFECPQCSNLFRIVVRQRRPNSKTLGHRFAKAAGYGTSA